MISEPAVTGFKNVVVGIDPERVKHQISQDDDKEGDMHDMGRE